MSILSLKFNRLYLYFIYIIKVGRSTKFNKKITMTLKMKQNIKNKSIIITIIIIAEIITRESDRILAHLHKKS